MIGIAVCGDGIWKDRFNVNIGSGAGNFHVLLGVLLLAMCMPLNRKGHSLRGIV